MDDQTLLQQFEALTLPFDQWTHRTHVKIAYLYLTTHPFPVALTKVRTGIKAYNAANDVPEGPTSGYHETMTHAFVHLIGFVIDAYGTCATADVFFDDHPELAQSKVLRLFYSRDRFMLAEAKTSFVEPDLTALPPLGDSGAS